MAQGILSFGTFFSFLQGLRRVLNGPINDKSILNEYTVDVSCSYYRTARVNSTYLYVTT